MYNTITMKTSKNIKTYLATLVTLLAIDSVWLSVVSPKIYKHYIGHLMAANVNLAPAALFYLLFPIGLVVFVIAPALSKKTRMQTIAQRAALLGLLCYATFDLSNQAILPHWPTTITIIDMSWGASLSAAVAIISYSFSKKFIK
jgi:uncharacterized membrane protein